MDYARFNYVAQPEDGIAVGDLVPGIGPYDVWATRWGYAPIPGAATPDDEKPTLDALGAGSRTGRPGTGSRRPTRVAPTPDRSRRRWAMRTPCSPPLWGCGTWSAWRAYAARRDRRRRGRRPLRRPRRSLRPPGGAVGHRDEPRRGGRRGRAFAAEARGAGGVCGSPRSPGRRRSRALAFLQAHAFETPMFLIDPDILRRIEPAGAPRADQREPGARAADAVEPEPPRPAGRAGGVRRARGVRAHRFPGRSPERSVVELEAPAVRIDAWRRNVQRVWLDLIRDRLGGRPARPRARCGRCSAGSCATSIRAIAAAAPRVADRATRTASRGRAGHGCAVARPAARRVRRRPGTGGPGWRSDGPTAATADPWGFAPFDPAAAPLSCWRDHAVRVAP